MKQIERIELNQGNYKRYVKVEDTLLLVEAAFKLGYTVHKFTNTKMLRFSDGETVRNIVGYISSLNSMSGFKYANNKLFTEILLRDAGIITTKSIRVTRAEWETGTHHEYTGEFPAVVKPKQDTLCGHGVILNIQHQKELHAAVDRSLKKYRSILIQRQQMTSNEFRLLVLDGAVIASIQRMHAFVTGNGKQTITELVEKKNAFRVDFKGHKLNPILFNDVTAQMLAKASMTPTSVPKKGQYVRLHLMNNIDYGGESRDVTDIVHPKNAEMAVKAAAAVGLRLAGIDILMDDISQPMTPENGLIAEVNHSPYLLFHEHPIHGAPQSVATKVVQALVEG